MASLAEINATLVQVADGRAELAEGSAGECGGECAVLQPIAGASAAASTGPHPGLLHHLVPGNHLPQFQYLQENDLT